MRVWDAKGKEHLDAVSGGVWTVNVGYGRESIANAVRDQLVQDELFRRLRRVDSRGAVRQALISKRCRG